LSKLQATTEYIVRSNDSLSISKKAYPLKIAKNSCSFRLSLHDNY